MRNATTQRPTSGAFDRPERSLLPKSFALLLTAATLAGAACTSPVLARSSDHGWHESERSIRAYDTWADGRLVDVQIRVDGEAAPLYVTPGREARHYFQAFAGRNYSVVLKNNTGRRIAVLMAVDGLNVLNGEMSALRSTEPMYVLSPYESATIRGWRTSLDEVRRFVFVDERRSYAERTGQGNSDMGWIRVLSFNEQRPWWDRRMKNYRGGSEPQAVPFESEMRSDAPAPATPEKSAAPQLRGEAVPPAQDNLVRGEEKSDGSFPGTGWGERREDRVNRVRFTPEPVALDHLVFRYEYASGLRALGIFPQRRWKDRLGERDGDVGFAQPPRW